MEIENNFKIHPEDELVICCARIIMDLKTKEKIVSIIHEDLDWQHVIQLASMHKLIPLLYHNLNSICPEMVPGDVLGELKDYYHANVRKNLLLTGELIKITNLLNLNGINSFTYKGPVLSILAYKNLALRNFNDIDSGDI